MTGSPAFKSRSSLSKVQRIQRRTSTSASVTEQYSDILDSRLTSEHNRERVDRELAKNSNILGANTKKQSGPGLSRSICSSLSSFIFPCKKAVKRKLNFDVDDGSDDVSSLQFSGRNISLCGFQSKTCSVVDNRSLPELCNATLSPNKNRYRYSGSYCRSSVSSVVSCRRRLFVESEPPQKKAKLTSPILCPKTKSKRKEIKLSLKKKFPGVPDSESARGGLLLNLAFSKYNLSNTKQEEVSVDFVDNMTVRTVKNKDLIQYSQIKKEESSICRSPVFMAIKKVKRKLNLEDHENSLSTYGRNLDAPKVIECNDNIPLIDGDDVLSKSDHSNAAGIVLNEKIAPKVGELSALRARCYNHKAAVSNSLNEHSPNLAFRKINERTIVFASPAVAQQTDPNQSPFSLGKMKLTKSFRNDLFKNSKLRSTLKNKIFDLSKGSVPEYVEKALTATTADNFSSMTKEGMFLRDEVREKTDKLTAMASRNSKITDDRHKLKSVCETLGLGFCDAAKKEDEHGHRKTVDRASLKIGKTCENSRDRQTSMQRSNRGYCVGDNLTKTALPEYLNSIQECDRRFLKSHMNRFLKDCLVSVGRRGPHEKEICANEIDEVIHASNTKSRSHIAGENNDKKFGDLRDSQIIIDNVDSQIKIPVIESINSQEEAIFIESVISQNECDSTSVSGSHSYDNVVLSYSATQRCNTHVPPKNLPYDASRKGNKYANTKTVHLAIHDRESTVPKNKPSSRSGNPSESGAKISRICDNDFKTKHVSNNAASYSCIQFTNPVQSTSASKSRQQVNISDSFGTSTKKNKKKKHAPNTLTLRLDKLLNREKSDFHMWEYELSKTKTNVDTSYTLPALFCVQKMWKEYSHLILVCNYFQQESPDLSYKLDRLRSLAKNVSNRIVVVLEPEYCPKNLTYSSVFQVLPPWKLLNFEKCDPLLMLKPRKLIIISEDGNPSAYKDLSLSSVSEATERTAFCSCERDSCECLLPDGYQFFIRSLVASDLGVFNSNDYLGFNHCDLDSFDPGCIRDVVTKHKLFPSQYLRLDLQILYAHRTAHQRDVTTFWYIVCVDAKKNVCCVLCQDEADRVLANVGKGVVFRFERILPWKMIPQKNVESFLRLINYNDIPDDVYEMLYSQSVVLFVMSKKRGNMQLV